MKFDSIEQFNHSMTKILLLNIEGFQKSKGKYLSYNHSFDLPKFTLSKVISNSEHISHCHLSEKKVIIVIPEHDVTLTCNGQKITFNELYIYTENNETYVHTPKDFDGYVLSIDESEIIPYMGIETLNFIKNNTEAIRLGKIELLGLSQFKEKIIKISKYSFHNHRELSNQVLIDIQEEILLQVMSLFSNLSSKKQAERKNINTSTRLIIINRALDYLRYNTDKNIAIPTLAALCFCSVRTLEYAFKVTYSLTPKEYLTIRRMHHIRKILSNASQKQFNDILKQHGVVNISRFNQDYLKLFGCYPE